MKYRKVIKANVDISEVSYGCMSLGLDHEKNANLLHHAVDLGINYFDTADLYDKGNNEVSVGKALNHIRDKIIIATKVGNEWNNDGTSWRWNPTKAYILKAVDQSLQRLQTDYIDIYQLHGGTIEDPIDETIEAFEILIEQGKIRHYGISSIRPNVIKAYIQKSNIVSVMMQYSLLDRRPEEECLQLLEENNIAVLVRGAVAKGLLINKPEKAYLGHEEEQVKDARELLHKYSKDNQYSSTMPLQYVLQQSAVKSIVAGMSTRNQITENVQAPAKEKISDKDYDLIQQSVSAFEYQNHR